MISRINRAHHRSVRLQMNPLLKNHDNERLVQAIVYFAHHTQSLGKVKLFKLLYLLDFEHFRQTGHSVTGQEYRAWKMGPVPAGLVQEWDDMNDELAGAIRIVPEQVFDHWREKIVPLRPFDSSQFTKRQLRLLEQIASQYRDAPSATMIDVTHAENGAWHTTWNHAAGQDQVIDYRLSIPESDPHRDAILESADFYQRILPNRTVTQSGTRSNV